MHLIDEATVVDRGERLRVWFLRQKDTWVRAADHPEASVDLSSAETSHAPCPPGTIWQRTVELLLPRHSLLLCRVTRPHIQESWSPIDYLKRGQWGTQRHITETYHRVVGNYRLVRVDSE